MKALVVRAAAKVNLALEIVRRRSDGFHEISTVMSTVDLSDSVRISAHEGLAVHLDGAEARGIDASDDLAGRAAQAMAGEAGRKADVLIEVTKRIPVAGGLGGGSSDAGAVIRGLNEWWGLEWPAERLERVASKIGSDVPFFVHGGSAHCGGRGDVVEPLRDMKAVRMLILVPPVGQRPEKTARMYGALTPTDFSDGHRAKRMAQRIARGAPPPAADLRNSFEAVVERTDAELVACFSMFRGAGAPQLHLSGAGPAVFAFIQQDVKAQALRRDLEAVGARVFEVRTLGRADALAMTREE